uniref:WW domain-containing protein n=2 Tax=Arion vulgaris TaxID=1028688 RepID=A0A0B6ZBF8_9EUPU
MKCWIYNLMMSDTNSDGSELCSSKLSTLDPATDLPPELMQAGWGKFWSKREGRSYYFNKITSESLWEPPVLGVKILWVSTQQQ